MNTENNMPNIDDLLQSLHQAAKGSRLGITGIATATGQRPQTLINKLNPEDISHNATLGDFIMVVIQSNNTDPIDTLCAMFNGQFTTRTANASQSILSGVMHAMSESADIIKIFDQYMEDGRIDETEQLLLLREAREAKKAITELENKLISSSGINDH